ncbi:hypothetical protein U9M48_016478 [Paspalum notatum var. saurae]|uniref:DUF4228 domain protein n=1 Tax=Paspalum notatum var. saurae TaxID=547442 RepID=A0AAQ3WMM0_PASNO
MGNIALSPCLHPAAATVRLVYWGGQARLLATAPITAGDVAAELPAPATDHLVCPADAFFVGLPVPAMSPGEELLPGRTYFVLPAARFPCLKALTAATLAALSPNTCASKTKVMLLAGPAGQCPFEYVKGAGAGGRAALIRVLPEFIEKLITCDDAAASARGKLNKVVPAPASAGLCSTPELKRHYAQLVGARGQQAWSPRLETIAECDRRRGLRAPVARLLSSR